MRYYVYKVIAINNVNMYNKGNVELFCKHEKGEVMEKTKPLIFRYIETNDGKAVYGAEFDAEAPLIPGFIAIKCKATADDTAQYINVSAIKNLVIDHEMLRMYSPAYFARGCTLNIRRIDA